MFKQVFYNYLTYVSAFICFAFLCTCKDTNIKPSAENKDDSSAVNTADMEPLISTKIILDKADSSIFPTSWQSGTISARAEVLDKTEQSRSRKIIIKGLAKYPAPVLNNNLTAVYVVKSLRYYGVYTGGTNSRISVYVVNDGTYTDRNIESIFHAELSSILLRNFPKNLDTTNWKLNNPIGFTYSEGDGVKAIKDGQAGQTLQDTTLAKGFLNQYAMSSLENDFNSFASRLLMGDAELWKAIEKYPKIKAKAELVIRFYSQVDAGFYHPTYFFKL